MNLMKAIRAFIAALKDDEKPAAPQIAHDRSHLTLLQILQNKARLIDFLKEDISNYSDQDIGAAVRKIHLDGAKVMDEYIALRPVLEEAEGASVTIPVGYDIQKIKVVGKVKGEAPYKGVIVHKGWQAQKTGLPKIKISEQSDIIQPAEVEIQ